MFDLSKNILSFSFESLKDALITRYFCVFELIRLRNKTLLQFRTGSARGKSALKINKGRGNYRKTPFLGSGVDHFLIQITFYWIKLRHQPEQIQKLQQVTN